MLKTNISKKGFLSIEDKILAYFFSHYRMYQTWSDNLPGSKKYSGIYCTCYKIISVTPKRWLKTQFFEKMQAFQRRIVFGLAFLVLSNMTNVRELFISVHKVFWQILWKLRDHFLNTQESAENTNFWKKWQIFQWIKYFGLILLVLSDITNVRERLIRFQKTSDKYWGSYKINSVTPKRLLKTKIL